MSLTIEHALKRTRESTSKVRTGCSTCKARRVKCDEAKPVCRRCAIGSRKCEYNTARASPPRQNVFKVYLPPAQCQPAFFVNDRGLNFFHQNLAAKLDGQYDSQFWSKLVLQLSHLEPSIRDAVSAISLIHQDVESALQHPAGYVDANPEALRKWNAAVKSLSARIEARPNSNLVPLVCCLLFTCIEFLKGNIDSALVHVHGGFRILAAVREKGNTSPDLGSHDLKAIEDHVVPMFSRLNVLCSLADELFPPIHTKMSKEDSPHEDVGDSRRRLVDISDTCIRFIRQSSMKAVEFKIEVDDLVEQVKLQTRLDAWRDQLDELVGRMQATGNPVEQEAFNLLMVHYKVMYIWLRACTSTGELGTDHYDADFEELVCYAAQIAKPGEETVTPQPLSFEMQILGPLYFTAMKCRNPVIRRRATELLQWVPRRECLWNAHHAYVTAKRVIELEESLLNEEGLPDETVRIHGLPLPGDESRIYTMHETPFAFRRFNHSIVSSPAYPGTVEAVFRTKPWGLLGEWKVDKEYIKL